MMNRRLFLGLAAAAPAAAFIARPAMAEEPWYFTESGLAIRGTDPVAYFTEGAPVAGSADHQLMWQGTTWRFASAENMMAFEMDPGSYAPQFGGYCAYAVSQGYTAPTDPEAWTIYEGKLYLNFSRRVRRIWERDIPGNIAAGEANWPAVLSA